MPGVTLDIADAAELAEMLEFLGEWLATGDECLHQSMAAFIGSSAYGLSQLRDDLNRFPFLLGATDGEQLFGEQYS